MYKKKIIVSLSVCLILYGFWVGYNQLFPRVISLHARSAYNIKTLAELEDITDSIVKVKVLGDGKQFIKYDTEKTPVFGCTITPVEIVKIYKSNNLTEKSIINIIEPYCYYTYPVIAQKSLLTIDNYKPLKEKKQYIIFLNKYEGTDENRLEAYDFASGRYGKYIAKNELTVNVNLDNISIDDLDLYEDNKQYKDVFREVINKYEQ